MAELNKMLSNNGMWTSESGKGFQWNILREKCVELDVLKGSPLFSIEEYELNEVPVTKADLLERLSSKAYPVNPFEMDSRSVLSAKTVPAPKRMLVKSPSMYVSV